MKQLSRISEPLKEALRHGMALRNLDKGKGYHVFIHHLTRQAVIHNVFEEYVECVQPRLGKCDTASKLFVLCFGHGRESLDKLTSLENLLRSKYQFE